MTPQEIAREAAKEIIKSSGYWGEHLDAYAERHAAIILTAAAKMVRESGAVEALECIDGYLAEDMPQGPELADMRFVTPGYRDAYAQVKAALAKLRAIGGKP